MATYHISNYGSLAAPGLRADLDGYVYTTAAEVLGGRWDTGGGDMDAEYAEEVASANRAATEESERAVARWRDDDAGDDGADTADTAPHAEHGVSGWYVDDPAGGRWIPDAEALAEIEASDDPAATAARICTDEPMRGTWHS